MFIATVSPRGGNQIDLLATEQNYEKHFLSMV